MTTEKEKYLAVLENVPIFAAIDREKLVRLYNACDLRTLPAGELLIREGTVAEEIYVLLEGEVSIFLNRGNSHLEVLRMGVGSCLGETSVIGIVRRTADVQLNVDSTFLILTRVQLMKLFTDDIELFALLVLNIARELARRLKDTDHYIETGE